MGRGLGAEGGVVTLVDTAKLCPTTCPAWPGPGPAEPCGAQEQPAPSRDPQHRGGVGESLFGAHMGHVPTEVPERGAGSSRGVCTAGAPTTPPGSLCCTADADIQFTGDQLITCY